MKKLLVSAVAIAFVFASCGKEDVTAPEITVPTDALVMDLGDNAAALKDVTAKDDQDGDLATANIQIQGLDFVGKSTLTYSIADKAENVGKATREATIKADKLFATYLGTQTGTVDDSYTIEAKKSSEVTSLVITNFAGQTLSVVFNGSGKSTIMDMEESKVNDGTYDGIITGTLEYKKTSTSYVLTEMKYKVVWDDGEVEEYIVALDVR